MSHAFGQVLFPDRAIMYFEYNGTSDSNTHPRLYKTAKELKDNWRMDTTGHVYLCSCNNSQPVQVANNYGNGSNQPGIACAECRVLLEPTFQDNWTFAEWSDDGLPDWWLR